MGVQADKISAQIHRSVQGVLSRGLNDPRVKGLVTVTRVDLSGDLLNATVLVAVHPESHADITMHGLRSAAAHIRHSIADALETRRTPHLSFKLDQGFRQEARVHAALREIAPPPETSDSTEPASS